MIMYQIYPSQWGSLKNITAKMDYFRDMGYDALWISPCYPSAGYDNGYDVTNYMNIDPKYGTLEDMQTLIASAHDRDIKILMDLVINHCADDNEIFKRAIAGDEYYQDYFHFYDEPQNDWDAIFGGSAWRYIPEINKYVFHAFTEGQIDWNFDCEKVWDYWEQVNDFWLNTMNIDGYRVDAVTHMAKSDWSTPKVERDYGATYKCAPKLEGYLSRLSKQIRGLKPGAFIMGEANGATPEVALRWIHAGYFDSIIAFEHLKPWKVEGVGDPDAVHDSIEKMRLWSDKLGDANVSYVQNHDLACAYDMLGISHEAICNLQFSMNGHKLIYNGQETGMENSVVGSTEPETIGRIERFVKDGMKLADAKALADKLSRDNSRVPINWENNISLTHYYRDRIRESKA